MNFYFCESCGKRLTDRDVDEGKARDKKLKGVYCAGCSVGVTTLETLPLTQQQARDLLKSETPAKDNEIPPAPAKARPSNAGIAAAARPSSVAISAAARRTRPEESKRNGVPALVWIAGGTALLAIPLVVLLAGSKPSLPAAPKPSEGPKENRTVARLPEDPAPRKEEKKPPVTPALPANPPVEPAPPSKPKPPVTPTPPAPPAAKPDEMTLDLGKGVKMEFVLVKAGEFKMGAADGDEDERPVHTVKIERPFYIGKYEVTVAQFRAFAEASKHQTFAEKAGSGATVKDGKWLDMDGMYWRKPGFEQGDNHPACGIAWFDAQAFCKWASAPGKILRLPSEEEWEYAARGPKSQAYPWGSTFSIASANVADAALLGKGFTLPWGETKENDGHPFTSPVGSYKSGVSWCGAFDMAGNVWEWCEEVYAGYEGANIKLPAVKSRVVRGGAFTDGPAECRSANRDDAMPGLHGSRLGFRVVCDP